MKVSAQCNRVNVSDGHAAVRVKLGKAATPATEALALLARGSGTAFSQHSQSLCAMSDRPQPDWIEMRETECEHYDRPPQARQRLIVIS